MMSSMLIFPAYGGEVILVSYVLGVGASVGTAAGRLD
jgi:hypothetical protein